MQSDDEDFEESVETLTPDRKIQNPEDRYSLRRTPARSQSEKLLEAKMDQQKLFVQLHQERKELQLRRVLNKEPTLKQELSSEHSLEVNHHHNFPILLQCFLNKIMELKQQLDTR
jgi:hypothetical protein